MKILKHAGIALMVLFSFVFLSCEEDLASSLSVPERIAAFQTGVNNESYSTLYTNFHPDMSSYQQIKEPGYFSNSPLQNTPITFGTPTVIDGANADEKTFAGSMTDGNDIVYAYTGTMRTESEGSDNWLIWELITHDGEFITRKLVD